MKEFNYIIKRILQMIPVLLVVTVVIFAGMRLIPGSPAITMLGDHATPQAVEEMNAFSRALLPCLTAAAAAGGMAGSAAAKYAATALAMDVLLSLTRTLLLPLAYALLAVRTAAAATGSSAEIKL